VSTVHPTPLYPISQSRGLLTLEDASLNRTLIPGQSREELPCPKMRWKGCLELFKEMQGIARSELRGWSRYGAGHVSLH
jgi:hypothetical protein